MTCRNCPPGIESFWEDADRDGSARDALEYELEARLDALRHHQREIERYEALGLDDHVERVADLLRAEAVAVRRIQSEIRRRRNRPRHL